MEDPKIKKLLEAYRTVVSGHETNYYHPFVELANGVLEKNTTKNNQDGNAYCRNDPTFIAGSFRERKPDVITTLKRLIFNLETRISARACSKKGLEECLFNWAKLIAFVEFKKDDLGVLNPFEVLQAGYLVFEMQRHSLRAHHHLHEHQNIPLPSLDPVCVTHSLILLVLTVDTRTSKKRSATNANSDSSNKRLGTGLSKEDVKVQCASYVLEMLSNGGLRTHVIGLLVSKDVLQP